MAGLFAVGEAGCWDMHGFNRLGGNSLAETIVTGRLIGASAARHAAGTSIDLPLAQALDAVAAAEARASGWLARQGNGPGVYDIRDRMAETMMEKVGIFRTGDELAEAVEVLRTLLGECGEAVLRSRIPGPNPELAFALRLEGMLRLALVTAMGALARTESRGAHFRSDFPLRDDANWLNRTLARWPDGAAEPMLDYEPVGPIDLPPGFRGYGRNELIEMTGSVEDYNAAVDDEQTKHGRLPPSEPTGSRLRWGEWEKVS